MLIISHNILSCVLWWNGKETWVSATRWNTYIFLIILGFKPRILRSCYGIWWRSESWTSSLLTDPWGCISPWECYESIIDTYMPTRLLMWFDKCNLPRWSWWCCQALFLLSEVRQHSCRTFPIKSQQGSSACETDIPGPAKLSTRFEHCMDMYLKMPNVKEWLLFTKAAKC